MCNLYNITTNQEAIRAITRAMIDHVGNLPPSLDVYPDRPAPRDQSDTSGPGVGQPDLGHALAAVCHPGQTRYRCHQHPQHQLTALAPLARLGKPLSSAVDHVLRVGGTKPKKTKRWFAINEERPLAFFAGI